MTAVMAVYDGQVFIPERPCNIDRGSKVALTVKTISSDFAERTVEREKKLAALSRITGVLSDNSMTLEEARKERLSRQ